MKNPTHLIHNALKSGKITSNYKKKKFKKSLFLLQLVSEITLEQYGKENIKGSYPKFISVFILTGNKSHHNIFQTSVL